MSSSGCLVGRCSRPCRPASVGGYGLGSSREPACKSRYPPAGSADLVAGRLGVTAACRYLAAPADGRSSGFRGHCRLDLVEDSLEHAVVKRLDPLAPDRLILPKYLALQPVTKERPAVHSLELEPVLDL